MNERLGDGSLWRNERKFEQSTDGKWVVLQGKEKHPDYTGKVTLKVSGGSVTAYLSAWVRKGERGPYMSLSLEYPQNEQRSLTIAQAQPAATMPIPQATMDEELPF